MKSTKNWGICSCNCGNKIMPGDEMAVVDGCLYLKGHETKHVTYIKPIKKEVIEKEKAKKIKANISNKIPKWIKLED